MLQWFNGNAYDKPYYAAGGIYPDLATLVKTIRDPTTEEKRGLPNNKRLVGKMWRRQM
jgi:hypothetical protein